MSKVIAVLFMSLWFAGCIDQNPYADNPNYNPPKAVDRGQYIHPAAMGLATVNASGVSQNAFDIDLTPGGSFQKVFVTYQFDSGSATSLQVNQPTLSADGCTSQPNIGWIEVPDKDGKGSTISTNIYWNEGDKAQTQDANLPYGQAQPITAHTGENVTMTVIADRSCTKLHGKFTVNLK